MGKVDNSTQTKSLLNKFFSMDFRHSLFYIKSASEQLKESETMDPRQQAELLQGISIAVNKSLKIMEEAEAAKRM